MSGIFCLLTSLEVHCPRHQPVCQQGQSLHIQHLSGPPTKPLIAFIIQRHVSSSAPACQDVVERTCKIVSCHKGTFATLLKYWYWKHSSKMGAPKWWNLHLENWRYVAQYLQVTTSISIDMDPLEYWIKETKTYSVPSTLIALFWHSVNPCIFCSNRMCIFYYRRIKSQQKISTYTLESWARNNSSQKSLH